MLRKKLSDFIDRDGYITLSGKLSVGEALAKWRKLAGSARICHVVYIVDEAGKFMGTVELKDLLLEDPKQPLKSVMDNEVVCVLEKDSIKHAVGVAVEEDVVEMPVLGKEGKLVGVVSSDKLIDAMDWLHTKNVYNLAGILKSKEDVSLNLDTVLRLAEGKALWLTISVVVSVFLAGGIMQHYEKVIVAMPAVAFFIPVLMAFGGNVGTQDATIIVRLLSRKDPGVMRQISGIFLAGLASVLILGVAMGLITAVMAMVFSPDVRLGMVLFASMVVIAVMGNLIGFIIPYASHKLKLDPALVSAPLVTMSVDILALLVYFMMIGAML